MPSQNNTGYPDPEVARLIRMKARRFRNCPEFMGEELEDLEQELHLKWLESRKHYDVKRGPIATYADFVLNNHIRNMLEARRAQKKAVQRCTCSLDDPVDEENEKGMTRHEIYNQDDYFSATGGRNRPQGEVQDLQLDLRRVLKRLPPRQRELARRLMNQSVSEAAREMKISRVTAHNWAKVISAVFAEGGLDEYCD